MTPSDRNLKEKITPIKDSSTVLDLIPVSFVIKGGSKVQFGFIAQDIESIPEIEHIVYKNPAGVRSVAYNQIIPLLVHQIQMLTNQISQLEKLVK